MSEHEILCEKSNQGSKDFLVGINCYVLGKLRLNNWRHGEPDLSFGKRNINECLEQHLSILECLMQVSVSWLAWGESPGLFVLEHDVKCQNWSSGVF